MKPSITVSDSPIAKQSDYTLFLVLLFLLPFGYKIAAPVLILWILFLIFTFFRKKDFSFKGRPLFIYTPVLLFLAYLVSIIWANDPQDAWSNIEIKLSLLFAPLLFPLNRKTYIEGKDMMERTFIAGTFISVLVCFGYAFAESVVVEMGSIVIETLPPRGWGNNFTYNDLSFLIHPGYLAMYINLCLVFLLGFLEKGVKVRLHKILVWAIIVFMVLTMVLLQSKVGILVSVLIILVSLFRLMRGSVTMFRRYIILSLLVLSVVFLSLSVERYKSALVSFAGIIKTGLPANSSENGNLVRFWIWDSAWSLIRENPVTGLGIDNSEQLLLEQYSSRNMGMATIMKYNVHNQFLEIWLQIGITGFLIFTSMLILMAWRSIKSGSLPYLMFSVIIISQCLIESMFERFSGVVLFAIFFILFEISNKKSSVNQKYSGFEEII